MSPQPGFEKLNSIFAKVKVEPSLKKLGKLIVGQKIWRIGGISDRSINAESLEARSSFILAEQTSEQSVLRNCKRKHARWYQHLLITIHCSLNHRRSAVRRSDSHEKSPRRSSSCSGFCYLRQAGPGALFVTARADHLTVPITWRARPVLWR